ncbi:Hypothetical predicted protein [Mytilus galloprovincialis]|nr:Hypothetical predicted protein [Mytilus galloprovincialis]
MQGLALADGLAAFCTYGFEPFFYMHYEVIGRDTLRIDAIYDTYTYDDINNTYTYDAINETYNFDAINDTFNYDDINDTYNFDAVSHVYDTYNFDDITDSDTKMEELKRLVVLKFPYCVMHYCQANLGDTFHLVSILLTASLGVQKFLAVACPIWSKIQINERKSCIVCCSCFLLTLAVNVPRFFVISLSRGKEGDICLVSEPHHTIQKYILAYYPIIYSIIFIMAVVPMLISTCFIVCILCRRKPVRGHAAASRVERKSCILIVCVMIVFFFTECPRLYINSTLFNTYRSNLDMQNVAIQKLSNENNQKDSVCFEDSLSHISGESCYSELPTYFKKEIVNKLEQFVFELEKINSTENIPLQVDLVYKDQLKQIYYKYLKDDFVLISTFLIKEKLRWLRQFYNDYAGIVFCSKVSNNTYWANVFIQCLDQNTEKFRKSSVILASSPYSEPMNYLLNIIAGHIDINLENLKLLVEILKLSMIIGCASNFVIYIVMSEKLRDTLNRTFKCREGQKTRIVARNMQIRG